MKLTVGAVLLVLAGSATGNVLWEFNGTCNTQTPFPRTVFCDPGSVVRFEALVTDDYLPGTVLAFNRGNPNHGQLLSLIYYDDSYARSVGGANVIAGAQPVNLLQLDGSVMLSMDPAVAFINASVDSILARAGFSTFRFGVEASSAPGPSAYNASGAGAFSIPEPASTSLFGIGLLGLALTRRR